MLVAAATIAAAASAVNVMSAAAVQPGRPFEVANGQADFRGTIVDNDTGETVDLAGALRVQTRLAGSDAEGWMVRWVADVPHATGTGETSGAHYAVQGIDSGALQLPPGPPTRSVTFEPSFALHLAGSGFHPPSPCRLLVAVTFDGEGRITGLDVHATEPVGPAA